MLFFKFLFITLFFFFFYNCYLFITLFDCAGSSLLHKGSGKPGLLCSCVCGFSLQRLLLLWSTGSRCVGFSSCSMGLAASSHVESFWARGWTHVPCIGRRILNHWTTKKVLYYCFLILYAPLPLFWCFFLFFFFLENLIYNIIFIACVFNTLNLLIFSLLTDRRDLGQKGNIFLKTLALWSLCPFS